MTDKQDEMRDWTVCGRSVGRARGWDQSDTFALILYDFEPELGSTLPSGTVTFYFENGTVESYDDDGNVITSVDLIEAIGNLPVSRTH